MVRRTADMTDAATVGRSSGLAAGLVCIACGVVGLGAGLSGCGGPKPAGETGAPRAQPGAGARVVVPRPDKQASNTACLDCHMDLANEPISAGHLEHGFGCAACHGNSVAHGEDEANITKPDVLFGRSEIEPFCRKCHPHHKTGKTYDAFVATWRGKRRPSGVMLLEDATCTDCHGSHFMANSGG